MSDNGIDDRQRLEKLLDLRDAAQGVTPAQVGYHMYLEKTRKSFLEGENTIKRDGALKEEIDEKVVKDLVKASELLQDYKGLEEFERKERKSKKSKEKELKKLRKQQKKLKKREVKMKISLEKNDLKEKVASELKNKFLFGGDILPSETIEDLVKDGYIKVINSKKEVKIREEKREDIDKPIKSERKSRRDFDVDSVSSPRSLSYPSSDSDSPRRESRSRSPRSRRGASDPRRSDRKRSRSLSRSRSRSMEIFGDRRPSKRPRSNTIHSIRDGPILAPEPADKSSDNGAVNSAELELRAKLLRALLEKQSSTQGSSLT